MNIQGLKPRTIPSKVPFIKDLLFHDKLLFIALTETWLRDHLDAEINIDGYKLFRQDRITSKQNRRGRDGGGTACYLKNEIAAGTDTIINFSNEAVDVLGLHIKVKDLVLITIYRKPDNRAGEYPSTHIQFKEALDELQESFIHLPNPTPDIVMLGDFNLPHTIWPVGAIKPGASSDEQIMIKDLLTLTNEFYLAQEIVTPTHNKGNTLDLLFTNNPELLHSYTSNETLFSDHHIVEGKINYKNSDCIVKEEITKSSNMSDSTNFEQLNFFSDNIKWEKVYEELKEINWKLEFRGLLPKEMFIRFSQICFSICERHIPRKRNLSKTSISIIPRERKNLMRTRKRKLDIISKPCSTTLKVKILAEVRTIEKKLKSSYEHDMAVNEHKAILAISKNSKYFYSYAKKFSKIKTTIGPLYDSAKKLVECPKKMAQILKHQYETVFSVPLEPMRSASDIFSTNDGTSEPLLTDIIFEPADIEEAIDEISASSAAGPDQYPALLLKQCKKHLSKPLYLIWKKSMSTGEIPSILKLGNIVPIHKGGSKGEAKNYRPVALTSHIIKIFEKVIRNHIVSHLEENGLLNPGQHGFRAGRSCLSQLLAHFETITQILEEGDNVDVVYLDFSKAFDKVDFQIILRKLNLLGITGNVGKWIYSFLTGRTQTVLVNGTHSNISDVKSGVPQGSVLGPLLFLILLGDIDESVASAFISSFADDTRVGHRVKVAGDTAALQQDLKSIYDWSARNNMEFNSEKFECIRYGKEKEFHNNTQYYSDIGTVITPKDQIKDLGVILSRNCTFKVQIDDIISTTNKLCAWILRTFRTRTSKLMILLWKSLVLSKLDYCSQLWSPSAKGDIQKLEMVQRSFIRKIDGVRNLSYWDQLKKLKLYSLERRRERYMIVYIWRILEHQVPDFTANWIHSINEEGRLGRRSNSPPVNNYASSDIKKVRYSSLSVRGPQLFNVLPAELRNLKNCSVESFKRALDRFLSTIPDEPLIPGYTVMRRADSNSIVDMVQHINQ